MEALARDALEKTLTVSSVLTEQEMNAIRDLNEERPLRLVDGSQDLNDSLCDFAAEGAAGSLDGSAMDYFSDAGMSSVPRAAEQLEYHTRRASLVPDYDYTAGLRGFLESANAKKRHATKKIPRPSSLHVLAPLMSSSGPHTRPLAGMETAPAVYTMLRRNVCSVQPVSPASHSSS